MQRAVDELRARSSAETVTVARDRLYEGGVLVALDLNTTSFTRVDGGLPVNDRERLYLETVEQVLGSSAKVVVDVEGTGNMIYLPIDKLMEQRSPARGADTPPTIRLDDGSELESEDPRARKER